MKRSSAVLETSGVSKCSTERLRASQEPLFRGPLSPQRAGRQLTRMLISSVFLPLILASTAVPAERPAVPEVTALEPELEALYRNLHEHPELAFHEERTAETLARRVKELGFEVTTGVGGTGLVAILRNGPGPSVMLRTESGSFAISAMPPALSVIGPYASSATMMPAIDSIDVAAIAIPYNPAHQ